MMYGHANDTLIDTNLCSSKGNNYINILFCIFCLR